MKIKYMLGVLIIFVLLACDGKEMVKHVANEAYNELKDKYNELVSEYDKIENKHNKLVDRYNKILEENKVLKEKLDDLENKRRETDDYFKNKPLESKKDSRDDLKFEKPIANKGLKPITTNKDIYNKCKACHGEKAEKKALGASKVIAGWNVNKIEKALVGYKDGSYGRAMKGVMQGQVASMSDEDIKNVAYYISRIK